MLFQGDAPEGSDTFQCQVIERDHVGGLRLMIWDKVKVPLCHYRVMHRKRVTSELHDSYFRLMTIKHSISKIERASNDYITELSSGSSWVRRARGSQLERRCGRESHTRPKGLSGALIELGSRGERERHNVAGHKFGVKILQLCSISSSLSHANPKQPFRTLAIKWEVNICLKKSSCVCLPFCVVYYCVWLIYCVSMYPAWTCICVYKHIYYVSI